MNVESKYHLLREKLRSERSTWLVTGVAGFIGSNLLETLLELNQRVVGLDNFATGHRRNLDEVQAKVGAQNWKSFRLIRGDIRSMDDCNSACQGIDYVLHQAALGSVPRSIGDPITTNAANVTGFLNMLVAAREAHVKNFVYAASSSTYGDHPGLPKIEERIGKPLSPYAVTKYVNELYGDVFARCYGFKSTGLRYFNVFGPRQDPSGAYAAVIPKWIAALIKGDQVYINGDGSTSRDFCFVENAVQANLLAATRDGVRPQSDIFNVAVGGRTDLSQLFKIIKGELMQHGIDVSQAYPIMKDFREGDVRHSQADISKAQELLGYEPEFDVARGIAVAMPWYLKTSNS